MKADVVAEADIIVALEAWCEQVGSHDLVDLLHSIRQLWSWRHHPPASEFVNFVGLCVGVRAAFACVEVASHHDPGCVAVDAWQAQEPR